MAGNGIVTSAKNTCMRSNNTPGKNGIESGANRMDMCVAFWPESRRRSLEADERYSWERC